MDGLKFPKPVRVRKETKALKPHHYSRTIVRKNHEYVRGQVARFRRRVEVYRACGGRIDVIDEATGEVNDLQPARCGLCVDHECLVSWQAGHWHHAERRHCDCLPPCTVFCCKSSHARAHNGRIEWE